MKCNRFHFGFYSKPLHYVVYLALFLKIDLRPIRREKGLTSINGSGTIFFTSKEEPSMRCLETRPEPKGFTLIELLIVIAIILILISIALPNFLEAQLRAKVTKIKADFKGLEIAIESYRTDYPRYPTPEDYRYLGGASQTIRDKYKRNSAYPVGYSISDAVELTTPTKYLTKIDLPDPFVGSGQHIDDIGKHTVRTYFYLCFETWAHVRMPGPRAKSYDAWMLASWGPDQDDSGSSFTIYNELYLNRFDFGSQGFYSPTNGSYSKGDINYVGGGARAPYSKLWSR